MVELKPITRIAWRRFMASEAGHEGMLYLREKIPNVNKGLPHEVQFDAGISQGYIKALDVISELLASEPLKDTRADND